MNWVNSAHDWERQESFQNWANCPYSSVIHIDFKWMRSVSTPGRSSSIRCSLIPGRDRGTHSHSMQVGPDTRKVSMVRVDECHVGEMGLRMERAKTRRKARADHSLRMDSREDVFYYFHFFTRHKEVESISSVRTPRLQLLGVCIRRFMTSKR